MLSPCEHITRSLSLSLEDIKVTAIVNWIFHVTDFFISFVIYCKYGLILLRYSSIDIVLLLSPYNILLHA